MTQHEKRSQECFELLDRTGDPSLCKERFPELASEIDNFWATRQQFLRQTPEGPSEDAFARSRYAFLSSVAQTPAPSRFSLKSIRLAFLGAVVGAMAVAAVSASAAVGGPAPGLEKLVNALDGNHGQAVREAAQEAESQTAGAQSGSASLAVCEAAHDRETLPPSAQSAPGQEGRDPKDCEKTNEAGLEKEDKDKNANLAACLAKQDRELPEGAQNAPGQQEKEPKDCDETEEGASLEEDEEDGSGPKNEPPGLKGDLPPGQEKKQSVVDTAGDEEESDLTECATKLDRSTLPPGAQVSPGLEDKELPCKEPTSTQAGNSEKPTGKPESLPGGPPNR